MVLPGENYCPQCGAPLSDGGSAAPAGIVPDQAQAWTGGVPETIEQLRAFCDANGMPLEKMRFFVGVNIRQPRAFGIYRDGDNFVVYKNKDDGSRAVRYHGPDEAYAVKELYEKLLDECHKRDIWPDGKPANYDEQRRKARRRTKIITIATVAVIIAISIVMLLVDRHAHRGDGYYRFGSDTYYRYGDSWYYYDYYDWTPANDYPYYDDYGDYYYGDAYDRSWGSSDFKSSETWNDIREQAHTDSSDYSSWDSGDTDWSSDW